jgi:hypothetical protein
MPTRRSAWPIAWRNDRQRPVQAGHGGGKPTAKIVQTAADKWAFVMHALGMGTDFAPGGGDAASEQVGGR